MQGTGRGMPGRVYPAVYPAVYTPGQYPPCRTLPGYTRACPVLPGMLAYSAAPTRVGVSEPWALVSGRAWAERLLCVECSSRCPRGQHSAQRCFNTSEEKELMIG